MPSVRHCEIAPFVTPRASHASCVLPKCSMTLSRSISKQYRVLYPLGQALYTECGLVSYAMETTTPERVQQMIDELGVDQVEFGKLAGASKAMVNHWLSGKVQSVAPEYAYALEITTPYRARWIMIGDGPERADKTITSVSKL